MTTTAAPPKPAARAVADPVIVKLGKQRRSRIKKLLRGQGSLMVEVNTTIQKLRDAGTIAADAQPVIVVIREKPSGLRLFG